MDQLEDFFDHEDALVSSTAKQLAVLKDGLDQGDMTQEMFEELVNDLLEVEHIQELSTSIKRKAVVAEAFSTMKEIAGFIF